MNDSLFSTNILIRRQCEEIVIKRLQEESTCGNLALSDVSDTEFERRVSEEMNKRTYLLKLERSFGQPPTLIKNDPKGRYGWRVNGRNGYYPRGNTVEDVYEKQWQYHLKELKEIKYCKLTIGELVDIYCEDKKALGKKVNTVSTWKTYMKFYLSDYWDRQVGSFTKKELTDIFIKTVSEKTPCFRTVCNVRSITKEIFSYASNDLGEKLPFNAIELWEKMCKETPKEKLKKKAPLQLFVQSEEDYSAEEMRAMIREAYKRDTLIAYMSVVSFFINARISEITGLLKENIDIDRGIIYIRTAFFRNNETHQYELDDPKKGKYRTVVIPNMAIPIFNRILDLRNHESIYLFAERNNTHKDEWINSKRLDRHVRNMCRAIGMENGKEKSVHDQRRTYIKIVDSVALPTALRKLLVGHELDSLEEAYMKTVDYTPDEVRDLIDPAFVRFLNKKARISNN